MVVLCLFLFPSMCTYHISISGSNIASKGSNSFAELQPLCPPLDPIFNFATFILKAAA